MQPWARAILCGVLVTGLGGCGKNPGPINAPTAFDPATSETIVTWPFWPVKMRVHPLTRLTSDPKSGARVLEVRVEFIDRYEHTTKCLGRVRVDLYDAELPGAGGIELWNIDLRNLHDNETYYDPVTRTYLLRFVLDDELQLPKRGLLQVFYLSARDERLDARLEVAFQ